MLRCEATKPFERRGHDLDLSAVRVRKLVIERLSRLAIDEHDADVPVRALVDHEVPSTRTEEVQPDDLFARTRHLEQLLERHAGHGRRET